MQRLFLCVRVLFLGMLFFPVSSFAAALPSARDIQVYPGAKEFLEIPVSNASELSESFSFSLMSATFSDERDQPELAAIDPDVLSWLSLSQSSMNLAAGASSSLMLTVAPPSTVAHQVLAIALVETTILPGQISLSHGSATLIFITIGNGDAKGACKGFLRSHAASDTTSSSQAVDIAIENSGSGILVPSGQIVLRGLFGWRFGEAAMNSLHHRVLPGQTRSWNVDLPSPPWWAIGSIVATVESDNFSVSNCEEIVVSQRWLSVGIVLVLVTILGGVGVRGSRLKHS